MSWKKIQTNKCWTYFDRTLFDDKECDHSKTSQWKYNFLLSVSELKATLHSNPHWQLKTLISVYDEDGFLKNHVTVTQRMCGVRNSLSAHCSLCVPCTGATAERSCESKATKSIARLSLSLKITKQALS